MSYSDGIRRELHIPVLKRRVENIRAVFGEPESLFEYGPPSGYFDRAAFRTLESVGFSQAIVAGLPESAREHLLYVHRERELAAYVELMARACIALEAPRRNGGPRPNIRLWDERLVMASEMLRMRPGASRGGPGASRLAAESLGAQKCSVHAVKKRVERAVKDVRGNWLSVIRWLSLDHHTGWSMFLCAEPIARKASIDGMDCWANPEQAAEDIALVNTVRMLLMASSGKLTTVRATDHSRVSGLRLAIDNSSAA